ncbi:MAG: nickel-responsive transcriptional regulator NikR [Elusimicrobia bacterium]|nr:nickel-responsive transcriptional regulator NikR [Elusimicrobiota bacterium]
MVGLVRFGVSLPKELLDKYDEVIRQKNYPTRSKALEDMMRAEISQNEITSDASTVVGCISIIYDHHKRELLNKLTDIQHDHQDVILSSQHIHLDHHSCFELIIVKGENNKVQELSNLIRAVKGVKHGNLQITSSK